MGIHRKLSEISRNSALDSRNDKTYIERELEAKSFFLVRLFCWHSAFAAFKRIKNSHFVVRTKTFLHFSPHPFAWRRHLYYFLTLIRFKIGGLVLLLHTFPYNTPDILDARYFIVYDFFLLSFAFILNWIVSPHKCEEHTPSAKQRATKKMVIWHFEEANVKERVRVM